MKPLLRIVGRLLLASAAMATGTRGIELQGDLRAHDPSTIIRDGGQYWLFHTGHGCRAKFSTDLRQWHDGPVVFPKPLEWWSRVVPESKLDCWAPDIIRLNNRFALYYSVSVFGKNTSAIGLTTTASLSAPLWKDEGVIIATGTRGNFNAIDPAVFRDGNRLWLAFGSYWSGIKLIELDPRTGKRFTTDSPMHALAAAPRPATDIEAAYLYQHNGWYYLFVNRGQCCQGVNSTYYVLVGRSRTVTGPYHDRDGRALIDGGGTPFLERRGRFIGPGHVGIFAEGGVEWCSYHYYDGDHDGRKTLMIEPLQWDAAGWPFIKHNKP